MTAIRITAPGGIIPRMAPRQLPNNAAQVAANVSPLPGEWRPLRKPSKVWSPALVGTVLSSIYRVDASTWWAWQVVGVRVERAPLEGEARYVYTGDGVPKITTKTLATPVSASGNPAAARTLGIPTPIPALTLSSTGGTGANETRFYVYTFYSDWNEESAASPVSNVITGKVDGTWSLSGMDTAPPNSGSVTAAVHSSGTVTVTLGTGNHYLRAGDRITITGVVGMTDLNAAWTVASTPANNTITITLTTAQTYTSGGSWSRQHPWGTCTKRIYRTAGTKADFQLVATGVSGSTYSDTLLTAAIPGDALISSAWVPPPTDLTGLCALPGGILCGWSGTRTICFSEPYQPHAWPVSYQIKVQDDVVGIAPFDANLGVATAGVPIVISGQDPGQMSVTRHNKPFPALSRYSVCSTGDGVVFATKNGLARMDVGGVAVFTDAYFTPEGWFALSPSQMTCVFDGTRLFIATPTASQLFIIKVGPDPSMVNAFQSISAALGDGATGNIYFASQGAVYLFDDFSTAPMTMDWWSKEYVLPKPSNLGAAKVEFDEVYSAQAAALLAAERTANAAANAAAMSSPLGGRGSINARMVNAYEVNGSNLTALPDTTTSIAFTYYADGKQIFSTNILDQKVFRLPGGYKADTFSVRIQANTQIRAVLVGDTPSSLASV